MTEELWYPRAKRTPAAACNVGGELIHDNVRLFVIHVAQGRLISGLDAWFDDCNAQVSAQFGVSRLGQVHQYVPLNRMAWHCADYNDRAIGIEHLGYSGQALTSVELSASLNLLTWLHAQFPKVPLRRTANPAGAGVIGHGELGVAGGDHPDCPGAPILAQFDRAYRRR